MKNLRINRTRSIQLQELQDADHFAVNPINEEIAVSTKKQLIFLKENRVRSVVNWESERAGNNIVSLTFRTDGNQVVAVLEDGRALVVDDDQVMVFEICDIVNSSATSAEWSPDEQTLAIADDYNIFLTDSSLIPFSEKSLLSGEQVKSGAVNVGWGSEETQFRGSAGKLKPGEKIEKEREEVENHSKQTVIHWRWDGECVVVSYFSIQKETRMMTVFDRNGEIMNNMNIRNLYLSNCFAHRPNANLICSAILNKDSHDTLVFYERNGETRNGYSVQWPRNESQSDKRIIENVSWNSSGTILAIHTTNGQKQYLEFWTLSNYEYTRKYVLVVRESDNSKKVLWKWGGEQESRVSVLYPNTGTYYTIDLHQVSSYCQMDSLNVVVATDSLRISSLTKRVVPPPMCEFTLCAPSNIIAHTISTHQIHVLTDEFKIYSYNQSGDSCSFELSSDDVISIPSDPSIDFIRDILYDESENSFILLTQTDNNNIIFELQNDCLTRIYENEYIGNIGWNHGTMEVEVATLDGKFYKLRSNEKLLDIGEFESVQVQYFKDHRISLTENASLFFDSSKIASNATSFLTRNSDILYIDFDNKLRFFDMKESKTTEDVRDVEMGCEIVSCANDSSNVILQAARGNLEGIQPRRFVMTQIRELLDEKEYINAFKCMKKHRIDMCYALSYTQEKLEEDIELWVKSTKDAQLLEQLIVSCTDKYSEEGNSLCTAVYTRISEFEDNKKKTDLFSVLLTSLLRSTPCRVKDALRAISEHVDNITDRKDVFTRKMLHHVSFFVPARELFNCALSTYDLKLSQQVAEASNYDPKEYLPVLNKVNRIACPLERKYRINVVREAWVDAIESLFELDSSEERGNEEEWWNDASGIIQRESIYQQALSIVKPTDKRYKECCGLYANELEKKIQWKEAGLFFELAGNKEKCLKCWEMSRDVDGLIASAKRMGIDSGKLKICAIKMSAALKESRQSKELAKALKLAGAPNTQIVQALSDGHEWSLARNEVEVGKDDGLKEAALARNETIQMELTQRPIDFERYRKRLTVVRENKLKRAVQFAAGEVEDLRDDISQISSISSRSGSSRVSMASTVRRRKQIEKKKSSLKEGGEYEDSALLNVLAEHYRWMEQTRTELAQLIPVLMSVGHAKEGFQLKKMSDEYAEKLQKQRTGIWPESLALQYLPGPLYAMFDATLEPSPIPMPPLFRLEPEIIAPSSTFSSVFP